MPRKREPVAVLEAKGKSHLGAAELASRRASEVNLPELPFVVPDTLTKQQAKEFQQIAAYLEGVNAQNAAHGGGSIYSGADSETVAQYIVCRDLAHKLQTDLEGTLEDSEATPTDKSKALARYKDMCNLARAYAGDLGFTVSSRMKIVLPGVEAVKADDYGDFGGF